MIIQRLLLSILLFTSAFSVLAQDWTLKLKSTVQLRTWTLTTMADKKERNIDGAKISLMQGDKVLSEVQSDTEGNFELEIPGNGNFQIYVSYPGCNAKKFYVSTKNVPAEVSGQKDKPNIIIGGFMMSKPFKGIDYLGLQQPLLAVEYKNTGFDKDKEISDKGVQIVQNIMDAEMTLINKFCFHTKAGDNALNKKNYKLAKECYTKALELIPNEDYPKIKLARAEDGIKEEQAKNEALAQEKAAQIEAQKIANQKAIEEKKKTENASFNKPAKTTTVSPASTSNKQSSQTNSVTPASTATAASSSSAGSQTATAPASSDDKKTKTKHTIKPGIGPK